MLFHVGQMSRDNSIGNAGQGTYVCAQGTLTGVFGMLILQVVIVRRYSN